MAQNVANTESKGFYKLSWLQRIGFGSGDLAQNLIYQTICMYLLFFYTDIYGLKPGHAATMFLVVRLVDVLWDPLVGTYVDKHNPKWGKYRSYLVLAGIPLTALAILCFWNGFADSDYTLKLVYAYVTYVGLSMLYTLINVPYGALNSSLTRDTDEITILTSVRMFMANVGGLAVSAGIPLLVYNGTTEQKTVTLKVTPVAPTAGQMWSSHFQGTAVDKTFDADDMAANDYFALSGGSAFAPVRGTGTIGKNKCWLEFAKQQTSGARQLTIVFDSEATGIRSMDNGQLIMDNWYDLNGRKIQKPARKGVYIKNGQKKVVK